MTVRIRTFFSLLVLLSTCAVAQVRPERVGKLIDYEPAWSPDGRSVAFISNRGGTMNLYVLGLEAFSVTRLTSGSWVDDTPAWSPDGKRIVFVSERDGNPELYVISADASGERRITDNPAADIHPSWSPDGATIVFTSSRNSHNTSNPDVWEIFSVAPDGSSLRQLTHGGVSSYASISPNRQEMVVRQERANNSDIYIVDFTGRVTKRLTKSEAFDGWPSWAPDGSNIVFARERGEEADIYIVNRNTGTLRRRVAGFGRCVSPKWSPSGREILFHCRRDGEIRLYKVAAQSGQEQSLVHSDHQESVGELEP